jgi:hypothetical protein
MMKPIEPTEEAPDLKNPEQDEPSVLDWLKSLLRGRPIPIPSVEEVEEKPPFEPELEPEPPLKPAPAPGTPFHLRLAHLRLPLAIFLALLAQFGIEDGGGLLWMKLLLYALSIGLGAWALWEEDFRLPTPASSPAPANAASFKPGYMAAAVAFSILTWLTSSQNQFRLSTVIFWISAVFSVMAAFWQGPAPWKGLQDRLRRFFRQGRGTFKVDAWGLLLLAVVVISIYYRLTQLAHVPPEMVSDHAEKLYDVLDVLNGRYSIFFPRNTGREALQFYLAAVTAKVLGTGVSFLTLKIGTALAGLVTLPYIYLLGKEAFDRNVGIVAMALAGIGYWPNVISRVGLRFPLYPLFAAPAMYYVVRGLRRKSVNDFLIGGLIVGVGLHGYSPSRIIPIVLAVGVGIYLLHRVARERGWAALTWLVAAGAVALVVVLPLLRFAVEHTDIFMMRTASRIGDPSRPLAEPALIILLKNVWKGLLMFGWDDGAVWVNSIPHRPALDWVTGGLFHLGIGMMVVRYVKKRSWIDVFLLVSIPLLQLPSTLSIAFPNENPATNRAAGAFIPAFIAAGVPLAFLTSWAANQFQAKRAWLIGFASAAGLFMLAAFNNYELVFREYQQLFRRSAWNTSEAGHIVRSFAESIGDYDKAHVVAFPHWMDTRLVGIQAGKPGKDYAIWPESFSTIATETDAQLFILNPRDTEALALLQEMFPNGVVQINASGIEGKNLLLYFVPPVSDVEPTEFEEAE